jgi:hypothetical protein
MYEKDAARTYSILVNAQTVLVHKRWITTIPLSAHVSKITNGQELKGSRNAAAPAGIYCLGDTRDGWGNCAVVKAYYFIIRTTSCSKWSCQRWRQGDWLGKQIAIYRIVIMGHAAVFSAAVLSLQCNCSRMFRLLRYGQAGAFCYCLLPRPRGTNQHLLAENFVRNGQKKKTHDGLYICDWDSPMRVYRNHLYIQPVYPVSKRLVNWCRESSLFVCLADDEPHFLRFGPEEDNFWSNISQENLSNDRTFLQ